MTERRCREPGCSTVLSAYNVESRCFVHQDPKFRKGSGTIKRQQLAAPPEDLTDEEAARYNRQDWSAPWSGR